MKGSGELSPKMNNFYVEMDTILMHTMNIPKKFAKIFKGSLREIVELEGPSGITWHVKMMRSKSSNTFAMRSGWKEFVIANRINKNDVLVFTYNGNSSFKVAIFDPNGCQKAAPFFAKKMETKTETQSEESNNSSIREISAPHNEVKKETISLSSGSSVGDESSSDFSSRATRERVCCKRKQREFVQKSSESDEQEHGTVRKRKTKENRAKIASSLYGIPLMTHLTKAQEEIANRMAQKTHKGSDLFVKILAYTDVSWALRFPSGFVCKVLQREKKKKITLLPADSDKRNSVTANYNLRKEKVGCISKGWCQFARINGLKQGDLCLFELRKQDKQGNLTMVVHFNN
ncbi:B3 domain-containing protein Os03g0622100-like [Carex rostrata]